MNPFAELHKGPDLLILPNAWDAGSARVIELAGARAIATSSAAVAWSHGYPDGEALPFDVLMNTVREIRRVVEIPITADIEAGYDDEDEDTVGDNVEYLIDAGATGINIEDGKGAPELLCDKIAAIKEQHGDEIWINARTDVYLASLATGEAAYEETVRRARLYREAGADSIFVPFAGEDALLVRLVKAIDAPLNVIAMPGLPSAARLKEIGVRRLSAGTGIAKVSLNRTFELAQAFLADGNSEPLGVPSLIAKGLNAVMRGN
jgi:2-methylisocitrate lyase-like PEP mutase family enzyme